MEPRGGIEKSKKEQAAIGWLCISADAFTQPGFDVGDQAIGGHAEIRDLAEWALPFPGTIAHSGRLWNGRLRGCSTMPTCC
jgi:hypothetical protein